MCRAPIRAVPKNMPEPEDETLTLDLLELLSRGPPGGAGGDPRGHLMARLSLGQLLIVRDDYIYIYIYIGWGVFLKGGWR